MEPEEKKQEVTAEQTPPETIPESSPEGNEEVDGKGVSYKNRYAESERKRQQQEEQLEEMTFRMNNLEQKIQPQAATPQVPVPNATPKSDMDEMIALGPKAYGEKIQKEMQHKQKLADAETLIREKYGAGRLQFGVAKVLDYAQKNMIDVNSDPTRAVAKILADMDKPISKPSAEDKKKTAEAIKNKPEGGKRPPAPPVNNNSELMDNVRSRGTIEDVAAALKEQWRQEEK